MAEELTASKTIDVSAAFKAAEGAMKFAERISCEVVIPAVNQLRYALCHVLEGDDEAAVRHCVRARYDAYEAAVGFFLDYIACGKNFPEKIAEIVSGVAEGCVQSGCALIGGETAEHPGMMPEDDYDLAGFAVGIVDKKNIFDTSSVKPGDIIIALPSSGVHSNGFSLVRKVFGVEALAGELGAKLLTPTRIYVKDILAMSELVSIKACAHITGGGFYENIPRALPDGVAAKVKKSDVRIHPLFTEIMETGNIPERDMFNTFNMGVGMCVIVDKADAEKALSAVEDAYILGECVEGEGVILW